MQINTSARDAAFAVLNTFELKPTSLINYQSNGRLVVIGDEEAIAFCRQWQNIPMPSFVATSHAEPNPSDLKHCVNPDQVGVTGYMGAFEVTWADSQGNTQSLQADVVLDLNAEPIIKLEIPPPGYFHATINAGNSAELEAEMQEQVGEFEKPRYFNYDASICAHGVNGQVVCTNCIDACPAGAIQSLTEMIEVNPYLCQGGGSCATVCPSGAIQYAYPSLADSGNQLRLMLQAFSAAQGEQAVVLFHGEQYSPQNLMQAQQNLLPLRVEELASVGMELCLSALAYGAAQVILLADASVPNLSLSRINQQVDWLQTLLKDLGLNPQQVSVQFENQTLQVVETTQSFLVAEHSMADRKRNAFYQALDHLVAQLKVRDVVSQLPEAAPFGMALIDETKCTLCMACVGACPGKALQDGSNREVPEVFFIESHCLQCGACVQTCPEDAIQLTSRLLFDRELRNRSRALNRDEPFACIDCGKPFAPTSVIHKMQERLKDHHMFNSPRALDRLKKCEDCRVVDIVQDSQAMQGDFGQPN